jgi:hypothetical protein
VNDLTIAMLAAELDVSRRSVERCLFARTLVPTSWVGARVRFSREYADQLKARAAAARAMGFTHIMPQVVATGPIGPQRRPPQKLSAREWAQQVRWRRPSRPRTVAERAAASAARGLAYDAALKGQREASRKSGRIGTFKIRGLDRRPRSKEEAVTALRAIAVIAWLDGGDNASTIKTTARRVARRLTRRPPTERDVAELSELVPCVARCQEDAASFLVPALAGVIAWCTD